MGVFDRFRLDGKRALITGGSRGLGRAMGEALTEAGADLVLGGRERESLEAAGKAGPGDAGPRRREQAWIRLAQRFQVRLVLDELPEGPLRVGATAAVTVYTTPDHALNPVAEF